MLRSDSEPTHVRSMPLLHSAQMKSDLIEIDTILEDDNIRVIDVLACGGERRECWLSFSSSAG